MPKQCITILSGISLTYAGITQIRLRKHKPSEGYNLSLKLADELQSARHPLSNGPKVAEILYKTKELLPHRVWEMKEELLRANPSYDVEINFSGDFKHETLELQGDDQLIRVAILNLMDNGCKYSPDHKVTINLTCTSRMALKA